MVSRTRVIPGTITLSYYINYVYIYSLHFIAAAPIPEAGRPLFARRATRDLLVLYCNMTYIIDFVLFKQTKIVYFLNDLCIPKVQYL